MPSWRRQGNNEIKCFHLFCIISVFSFRTFFQVFLRCPKWKQSILHSLRMLYHWVFTILKSLNTTFGATCAVYLAVLLSRLQKKCKTLFLLCIGSLSLLPWPSTNPTALHLAKSELSSITSYHPNLLLILTKFFFCFNVTYHRINDVFFPELFRVTRKIFFIYFLSKQSKERLIWCLKLHGSAVFSEDFFSKSNSITAFCDQKCNSPNLPTFCSHQNELQLRSEFLNLHLIFDYLVCITFSFPFELCSDFRW